MSKIFKPMQYGACIIFMTKDGMLKLNYSGLNDGVNFVMALSSLIDNLLDKDTIFNINIENHNSVSYLTKEMKEEYAKRKEYLKSNK